MPTIYGCDNGPGTPLVFKVLNPPLGVTTRDEFPTRLAAEIACGIHRAAADMNTPPLEKAA